MRIYLLPDSVIVSEPNITKVADSNGLVKVEVITVALGTLIIFNFLSYKSGLTCLRTQVITNNSLSIID